jgi:conjugal transfer pilus assembly protein TraB
MLPRSLTKFVERLKLDRKLQQQALFYGATVVGVLVMGGGVYWWKKPGEVVNLTPTKKPSLSQIASGAHNISPQELWGDKFEKKLDTLTKSHEEIVAIVKLLAGQKLTKDIQDNEEQPRESDTHHLTGKLQGQPADSLGHMRNQLQNLKETEKKKTTTEIQQLVPSQIAPDRASVEKAEIKKISFQLDARGSKRITKSIDHYVPAGSFAKGALTSGVVASTAVGSSSNPRPVHIQLTDFGNLPRRFRTDIKGCFIIGTSYGDIASERVFMRLEKLSCVERKTGEIIEHTVDGYAAGEDGAVGIRGVLVDRSGPAMRNAFIGGFVGGMGNFFTSQQSTPLSVVGGGIANINPMTTQHLLQAGAGKGVGNAMEKLSDFYIKRAEQLQPVLEIEAGRRVDIVFTNGFDMAQTVYRRSLMAENDQERRNIINQNRDTSQQANPTFASHQTHSNQESQTQVPGAPASQAVSGTQGGFYESH